MKVIQTRLILRLVLTFGVTLFVYLDRDDISEYAVTAMKYAVGAGIIHGKTSTAIAPQDKATRAEAATMLKRLIELYTEE